MSGRIDAIGDSLVRTATLPAATPLMLTARVCLMADRNAAGILWQLVSANGAIYQDVRVGADGTTLRVQTNAVGADDGALTVGLSGGVVGVAYPVACHVVTAAGREDDRTLMITIRER